MDQLCKSVDIAFEDWTVIAAVSSSIRSSLVVIIHTDQEEKHSRNYNVQSLSRG